MLKFQCTTHQTTYNHQLLKMVEWGVSLSFGLQNKLNTGWSKRKVRKIFAYISKNIWATKIFHTFLRLWAWDIYACVSCWKFFPHLCTIFTWLILMIVEEMWPTLFFIFRRGHTSSTFLNSCSFQRYRPLLPVHWDIFKLTPFDSVNI